MLMEYSCFDFNFLEVDKKVSSLEDFIHFIDAEFEFDIWSLGLMMFAIINPNLTHPYSAEFERSGISFSDKALTDFLKRQELPCHDNKYEYFRITQWWQIEEVFKLCAKYDPRSRPTPAEALRLLDRNQPEASLRLVNLSVNQSSAQTPENDGTNCSAFLAMSICDRIVNEVN